jgi:hypothetical protein
VGGKIAQVGSRLIDMTAKKMADIFFGKFSELISTEEKPSNEIQHEQKVHQQNQSKIKTTNQKILIYASGVAAAAILIYLFF